MYDRLLFLTIQNKTESLPVHLPKILQSLKTPINSNNSLGTSQLTGRLKRKPIPSQTGSHELWDYKMLITGEVTELLNLNETRQDKKRNLFKSSLHFM
jgi:hypothetical protein